MRQNGVRLGGRRAHRGLLDHRVELVQRRAPKGGSQDGGVGAVVLYRVEVEEVIEVLLPLERGELRLRVRQPRLIRSQSLPRPVKRLSSRCSRHLTSGTSTDVRFAVTARLQASKPGVFDVIDVTNIVTVDAHLDVGIDEVDAHSVGGWLG
jgi:hypothetical protein